MVILNSYSIATQAHEGDIAILLSRNGVLHEDKNGKTSRVERGAVKDRRFLWSNASVPYVISNTFSGEYIISRGNKSGAILSLDEEVHEVSNVG